ncbi:MAG: hypothetical protein GXO43_02270 [Crenarchaeota archaeon]|nr:hypothetical protein [Thermoproteota archaeon]
MNRRDFEELYEYLEDKVRDYYNEKVGAINDRIGKIIDEEDKKLRDRIIEDIKKGNYDISYSATTYSEGGIYFSLTNVVYLKRKLAGEEFRKIGHMIVQKTKPLYDELEKLKEEKHKMLRKLHDWRMECISTDAYKNPKLPKEFKKILPKGLHHLIEE